MAKSTGQDGSLKRLGGGRWQTKDDRFTIEPQSGTWVVVDADQTDDLGLPLIRGPFASLGAARDAIATARDAAPAVSPLAAKVAELRTRPTARKPPVAAIKVEPRPRVPATEPKPKQRAEPTWLTDLDPVARGRARDLIDRLGEAGASDPEGIARRDLIGRVPAAAAYAVDRALAALGPEASPAAVARLLTDGRDADIGVRWRLVDGDGRPITLERAARAKS